MRRMPVVAYWAMSSQRMPRPDSGVPEDDQTLIGAVAGGDAESLGRLYDRYGPVLRALGHKLLGDRRDAEEIMHEVFLEAWRQAHEYDPRRGSVRSWLILRMRSRAIDRRRMAYFSRQVALDPQRLAAYDRPGDGDDFLSTSDHATVHRALAELSAEQQQVLELTYFQGLPGAEVAQCLGVPVGTVKSRLAAALANLRHQLVARGSQ